MALTRKPFISSGGYSMIEMLVALVITSVFARGTIGLTNHLGGVISKENIRRDIESVRHAVRSTYACPANSPTWGPSDVGSLVAVPTRLNLSAPGLLSPALISADGTTRIGNYCVRARIGSEAPLAGLVLDYARVVDGNCSTWEPSPLFSTILPC